RYAHRAARDPGGAEVLPLANRALFFAVLAAAMLPAAFWAGASDKLPLMMAEAKTTMRNTLAQALHHRGFLVMSGAYFVCGLNLVFLTTHLRAYLEICGQDPMLSAEALAVIGAVQLRRCLAGGLAWRPVSEARRVGLALYPAVGCIRRLLRGPPYGDQHADLCGGDGLAMVPRGMAAPKRLGRRDVWHPLHGDAPRDLLRHPSGRRFAGSVGRRHHFRCHGIL